MKSGPVLLIRADASLTIGTGHVMRCLALAQAWQDGGGAALFLSAPLPPALEERLRAEGVTVMALAAAPGSPEDAAETTRLANEQDAAWVALDGYQFDAAYQKAVKEARANLLALDDNGDSAFYWADLVLNQNIHAQANWYEYRAPHTRLLLGTRYALLRREFLTWREWQREVPETASKVLVTLGGSDPGNVTLKIIEALSEVQAERLEATVVIGGSNPHRASLEAAAGRAPFSIQLVSNAANMPELMAWADVAISAAGSTCWELAFMGLPSLLLILAENQLGIALGLNEAGTAVSLGWASHLEPPHLADTLTALLTSEQERACMSRRARQLVDGLGAERVSAILTAE